MGLETNKNKRAGAWTLVCVLALAVLLLLLIWRVPFGYDWTDESDYLALPYRLLTFDRPLVDTWEVHQLSAMISVPLVWLYLLISQGSTDGILLFFRYSFILIQFGVSVYAFFVLRKKYGDLPAVLAAGLFLSYTHYAINSLYYNTYALLFLTLSVLLVFDARGPQRGRLLRSAFSGLFFALSVQAQPYVLLAGFVWAGFWLSEKRDRRIKKELLCWLGGIAAVVAAFILSVLLRSDIAQIPANVKGMLSDPAYPKISYFVQIGKYLNSIRVIYQPVSYLAAAFLLFGIVAPRIRDGKKRRTYRLAGIALACALMVAAVKCAWSYEWEDVLRINMMAMSLALAAPGLFFLNGHKMDEAAYLFLFGCALSVATQYGSNTRIYASSGMLVLSSMAAVVMLFDSLKTIDSRQAAVDGSESGKRNRGAVLFRIAAACVCAFAVTGLMRLRLTTTYRDDSISNLSTRITAGPAKGLITSAEEAEKYECLISDIRENAPETGTILVSNLFPDGYMLTDLTPAAPGEFNMSVAFLTSYYEQHPERWPDYIFAIDASFGKANAKSTEISQFLTQEKSYRANQLESGTAYTLTGD